MQFIGPDVHTIVMGQACSMGSLLAQAGSPGKRFILPNARHMIHQPSGGARGQATDMLIQVNEILEMKRNLTNIYVKHNSVGKTFEQLAADMVTFITPIRTQAAEIQQNKELLQKIIRQGAEKARISAGATLKLVRNAMGMN